MVRAKKGGGKKGGGAKAPVKEPEAQTAAPDVDLEKVAKDAKKDAVSDDGGISLMQTR